MWSPKHPTQSDSWGLVWIHWTATSFCISLLCISLKSFAISLSLIFQIHLHWCGNKPVLTTLPLSIPVFIYLPLAAFILLQLHGSLHPPLVLCFFFLFAKEVAEAGTWYSVWFHGKGKDDLVYFQPRFLFSPLIKSNIVMEAPRSEIVCAVNK